MSSTKIRQNVAVVPLIDHRRIIDCVCLTSVVVKTNLTATSSARSHDLEPNQIRSLSVSLAS